MTRRKHAVEDLGLAAVERIREAMGIDQAWSVSEDRGFTWWGAWVRERIWADEAIASYGSTLWQVRARTPALRDQPDEPATYLLVDALNDLAAMSAYVYDPDDGTISARCGAFLYGDVASWLGRFLQLAVALQPSIAWQQVPAFAEGRPLDDAPHPKAGSRSDPDDMLNLAAQQPAGASPFTPAVLHEAFVVLEADGFPTSWDPSGNHLMAFVPLGADDAARWTIGSGEHPVIGRGAVIGLQLRGRIGRVQAAWVANALNAAEVADWQGEARPHALGRWSGNDGFVAHTLFCPAAVIGDADRGDALLLLRNFFAWDRARAVFASERLPWLLTAARSRFPEDEPPADDESATDGGTPDDPAGSPDAPGRGAPDADEGFDPESWGVRIHMPGERPERGEAGGNQGLPDPFDLLRQGRQADAVVVVEAHIAMAQENLRRMHQLRSEVLLDLERWGEALADIDAALVLNPAGDELVGFLGTRGWALCRLGRHAEGLAELDRALAIGTEDAGMTSRLHVNRGLALSRLGDKAGALAEYDIAERFAPDDAIVRYDRACVLSQVGRLEGAFDSLRIGLSLDASYRPKARHDDDFANLRGDAAFGPRFRELVGADD